VENVALHIAVKGDVVGVISADGVWILDPDQVVIVIGHQHNASVFGQALVHTVAMALGCTLGPTLGATDVPVESLFASRGDELDQTKSKEQNASQQCFLHR